MEAQKKEKNRKEMTQRAILMFVESTGWIAGPVIVALLVGRWLDARYDTEPFYSLALTVFAFVVSSIGIGMTGAKYIKRIEKEEEQKKKEKKLVDNQSNEIEN